MIFYMMNCALVLAQTVRVSTVCICSNQSGVTDTLHGVKFQVLTATRIKMAVFWVVAPGTQAEFH
jgi:hypothetical protein